MVAQLIRSEAECATEERGSAFQDAAFLLYSGIFHINTSEIRCLKWEKVSVNREICDKSIWIRQALNV